MEITITENKQMSTNMNNYENDHRIINTIPFDYPEEESSESIMMSDQLQINGLLDFIFHFVLTSKHPRRTLSALGFACGYDIGDIYNCENTGRSIAKALGISNVSFHRELQSISSSIQLVPRYNY